MTPLENVQGQFRDVSYFEKTLITFFRIKQDTVDTLLFDVTLIRARVGDAFPSLASVRP
jgi:hypothetical protein